MKTSIRLIAVLLLAAVLCGCTNGLPKQTIVCNELSITLPGSFLDFSEESSVDGLAFNYATQTVGVCATFENRETLTAIVKDIDAHRYAELFLQTNGIDSVLLEVDGIPQFSYESTDQKTMTYLCGVFASEENFWVVQAYCESKDFAAHEAEMWEYIKTVKIR